jgi:NAD dependent epimerase/dehydratase family enzyme
LAENNKKGVFNAVAPEPSTVNQIFKEMIRVKNQFILKIHAPQFALKLILGEMAIEVLKSCHVSSQKIVDTGFVFQYPDISSCIQSLLKPKS